MTGEGDGYWEVVGPRRIREEMPAQKGDIWRGGLALGGEASREIEAKRKGQSTVRNLLLRTVNRPI